MGSKHTPLLLQKIILNTMNQKDIQFIKQYFKQNPDLNFEYSWQHAVRTAKYIKKIISKHKEVPTNKIQDMTYAALGHDLLEDTTITQKEIKKEWGANTLSYIKKLSNRQGDEDFDEYIKDLKTSPEEILLIKLADIYDNSQNSIKKIKDFAPKWINNFWLPLLKRYQKELFSIKFKKYPRTSSAIIKEIEKNIKIIKKRNPQ